jgi:hypothetical protein
LVYRITPGDDIIGAATVSARGTNQLGIYIATCQYNDCKSIFMKAVIFWSNNLSLNGHRVDTPNPSKTIMQLSKIPPEWF